MGLFPSITLPAVLLAVCFLGLFAPSAVAQTGQGTLVGQVNDTSGAIIAGVAVGITNKETGFVYSAFSNEEGLYRTPYLNPGIYDIAFEAQGFKKLLRSDIQVRSTETARLDVVLEVGSVAESIEISARAALLETETLLLVIWSPVSSWLNCPLRR